MIAHLNRLWGMLVLCISMSYLAQAQTPAIDSVRRINIIKADRQNYTDKDSLGKFLSYAGNVVLQQEKTLFYSDSAVLNLNENTFEAFGNIHINDADSVHTYSQYLKYIGKEKVAFLKRKVKLTDGLAVLTTDDLEYNMFTKVGVYLKGGKVVNGKTVLTSTEGHYFGETRDVYFKKKVVLVDPEYKVYTDTLLYNTYTQISRFVSPTRIISDDRTINTSEGYYDVKAKKSFFGKRPTIKDSTNTLVADEVAFDQATGFGEAQGNVVYKTNDTANNYTILSNNLKSNSNTGAVLATQKPFLIIKQGRDSVFVAADTLYSGKLTETRKYRTIPDIVDSATLAATKANYKKDSSNNRFFEGYYNVRIFTDSMQAIGDSMFYSFEDSAFRLFKNPVVWAQENQISGDTIYAFTQNKKPKRFYVFENALAVNKVEKAFFNQMKGTTINAFFKEGNIDSVRAKGSAESIYYSADEDGGYIGVNRATSDVVDMYFRNRQVSKIVPRNNLKGTITPIKQVNHDEMKLRGFKWMEEKRPKSKFDLLGS